MKLCLIFASIVLCHSVFAHQASATEETQSLLGDRRNASIRAGISIPDNEVLKHIPTDLSDCFLLKHQVVGDYANTLKVIRNFAGSSEISSKEKQIVEYCFSRLIQSQQVKIPDGLFDRFINTVQQVFQDSDSSETLNDSSYLQKWFLVALRSSLGICDDLNQNPNIQYFDLENSQTEEFAYASRRLEIIEEGKRLCLVPYLLLADTDTIARACDKWPDQFPEKSILLQELIRRKEST